MILRILSLSIAFATSIAIAQESSTEPSPEESGSSAHEASQEMPKAEKETPFHAQKKLKIIYASSPWNKNSTQPDSAFIILRDSDSGKTAKIVLEETEPDSSTFAGDFSLGFADGGNFTPEIYIPPQSLREGQEGMDRFYALLNAGKIAKRPTVLKTDEEGRQLLDVYDTTQQAVRAKQVYEKELEQRKSSKGLTKPIPSESTMETAEQAKRRALMEKLSTEAQQREIERLKMEQIERQKALRREREAKRMDDAERARRAAEAKRISEEAMTLYKEGKYPEAEKKFRQAIEMDPMDRSYYYYYGVTLYRLEKFNEALVAINISPKEEKLENEKNYYKGLIHYRLTELDQALSAFQMVKESKDPVMGPSAAFYEGIVLFSQEKYEESKGAFEYVLDNSQDPSLDKLAEEYVEKIISIIQYLEQAKKKIFLNASLGVMYDSNVTLAADNVESQGTATDQDSVRGVFIGDAQYRFLYTANNEFSTKLSTYYVYSAKEEVSTADAAVLSLSTPYTRKGTIGKSKKGFSWVIAPMYETTLMDPYETGQTPFMPVLLKSPVLSSDFTLINSDKWFSTYSLEVRQDNSDLEITSADDDADAMKYTLGTSQSLFLDDAKKRALVANLGAIMNDAKGVNNTYMRYDAGVTYITPVKWDATWSLGLAVYRANYPDKETERKDFNTTLNTSLSKPIKEWFTWALTGSYTKNASNSESNDYSKYTVMTTATFNCSL